MRIRMTLMTLLAVALLAACNDDKASNPQPQPPPAVAAAPSPAAPAPAPAAMSEEKTPAKTGVGLANPASANCGKMGGKTVIRKDSKGGEVGYCVFSDGSECEEWALMRGKCKPGDYNPKPAPPSAKKPSGGQPTSVGR